MEYLETSKAHDSAGAAQPLNALRLLSVYPVFEDKRQMGHTKNRIEDHMTNIIATNCV